MSAVANECGNLWPSPAQELLLKAALDGDGRAVDHYLAWRERIDLEAEFDRGSYRLLPLLYDTIARRGHDDRLMGRLKGTYRRTWCETQTRLQQAAEILRLFRAAGIETLVIKGLPLAVGIYRNPTLRPMSDLDVVVRRARAVEAIRLLEAHGWKRGPTARDDDVTYHHAMQFFHPAGGEVDLHWQALMDCPGAQAEAWFWEHAQEVQVKDVATLAPDATGLLLQTIIHGVRWNIEPPIRWIADATMILGRGREPVDWQRLLAFAVDQRLTCRLGLGLSHLAERFQQPIPATVLADLRRQPPSLVERIENTIALTNADRLYQHLLLMNWVIFARYCRLQQARNPLQFINGFSHFLRVKWQLEGRSQLPAAIATGLLRRLRRPAPTVSPQ